MRWWVLSLALALASTAVGCGGADCEQSGDIQVTIAPNDDVPIADITHLHVMLSVADGPVRALMPDIDLSQHPLAMSGDAFLLHPDPAPSDKYNIALTLQAFDAAGDLVAIGSESMEALIKGCNRLTVHLAALPLQMPGPDMAAPPGSDLAGQPMGGPDMAAACIGATPDEDNDGRANVCDLCPADPDPTPVDTDGDGLPDACDPDPAMGVNTLVYFEPFDVVNGHWSGNSPISGSYMNVDTNGVGTSNASNATDMMPLLVRVQAMILPTAEHGNGGGDTGVFLGTSPNVNQATGVYCALTWNGGGSPDTLDIYKVTNGGFGVPMTANLGAQISGTVYRLRLTQHAGIWSCEVLASGMTTPVTVMTTQTVTAPLFITLENDNMGSHFHSIVAESKLP